MILEAVWIMEIAQIINDAFQIGANISKFSQSYGWNKWELYVI